MDEQEDPIPLMVFVDIDEEVDRLQLTDDWGRAVVIAELADRFPDLRLFRDCWGNLRHCSKTANPQVDAMEMDSCHNCDGKPLKVWPYLVVGKAGERLYSDPPCFTVADQNQQGFGEIPRAAWREGLEAEGIGLSVIRKVAWHLRAHPPINYFGDDNEAPGAKAASGRADDPDKVPV
jgi:hypothetical protein